jgi:hypothetical protein
VNVLAFLYNCRPVWRRVETPASKECRRCKDHLPLDRFHRNHRMRDGHLNVCKACRRG